LAPRGVCLGPLRRPRDLGDGAGRPDPDAADRARHVARKPAPGPGDLAGRLEDRLLGGTRRRPEHLADGGAGRPSRALDREGITAGMAAGPEAVVGVRIRRERIAAGLAL